MAVAFFPDMDGVGVEAGWTARNMGLKSQGHDVGSNDYDVVIHFDNCRKCAAQANCTDGQGHYWLIEGDEDYGTPGTCLVCGIARPKAPSASGPDDLPFE